MPTVLITGGTGLVGTALTPMLVAKGYDVIIMSRSKKLSNDPKISYAVWHVEKGIIDESAVAKADHIIHLAGAGVAEKRWTNNRKQEIVNSRIDSSKLLVDSLQKHHSITKSVVSASAIGWYGADKKLKNTSASFTEDMPPDTGFLGETCKLWEASIQPVKALGIRLVTYRFGIVLSNEGGAFAEFKKPVQFGIAGILGNGKQVISWVHIDDICRLLIFALDHEIDGVFNAVAPNPVTNKSLTKSLAQKLKGNFYIPMHVPAFALKIALGEMSTEVLKSATVSCEKIRLQGFQFLYPTIESALGELTGKK